MELEEIKNWIVECGNAIETVNSENIVRIVVEDGKLTADLWYGGMGWELSDFAENFLSENEIVLYDSPLADYPLADYIEKIATSESEKEIIEALEEYASELESWMEVEIFNENTSPDTIYRMLGAKKSETIYEKSWNVFHYGQFEGTASFSVDKKLYKLGNVEFELFVAYLYDPAFGWLRFVTKDERDVEDLIEHARDLFEKLDDDEIDSVGVIREIREWIVRGDKQ